MATRLPLDAPTGITKLTCVAETTRNPVIAIPLIVIELTPTRLVPVSVMVTPAEPLVAEIAVIVGAAEVAE